ncbi:MAG: alkaline phosphatase family protein [Rubrobacteraceae bacterium]
MTSLDHDSPKPFLLLVLDGIRPDVLRAAIRDGEAPTLGALAERGEAVWDAASVFPSITPAATAAIVTGEHPAGSGIYGHAWYNEAEDQIVIYGAMTETVITSGPLQVLHNNVWRMNRDDLYADTIFERLHEIGVEGACVNFPIRRGPYRHRVRMKSLESMANVGELLDTTVSGPREYYMGDLFYSRDLGLHGRKGSGGLRRQVGMNDEYAARVGAALLKEKAEPFTLVYFFEGDSLAHHEGLAAQRRYVGALDGYVKGMLEAGGGLERVIEEYAVLVVSDHGHTQLLPERRYVRLDGIMGERTATGARARLRPKVGVLVVPNGRAALVYLKGGVDRGRVIDDLLGRRGVDLATYEEAGWVVVRKPGRKLRFRPGAGQKDPAGRSWELVGDAGALDLRVSSETLVYGEYPDALERLWGSVRSSRAGDVVLSASPGYTFGEVNGNFHKQSDHGSLHADDSNVFSIGLGLPAPRRITDVAPTILDHFGAGTAGGAKVAEGRVL